MAHVEKASCHKERSRGRTGDHNPNSREHEEERVNALTCKALGQREGFKKKKGEEQMPSKGDTLTRTGKGKLINQSSTEQSPITPTIDGSPWNNGTSSLF